VSSDAEVFAREGLTKLPIRWCHVLRSRGAAIAASNPERKRLAHENGVGLPVLSPVTAHAHPISLGALDPHIHDIPCTRHVGHQNQVEVTETVDSESDASLLPARYPENKNKSKYNLPPPEYDKVDRCFYL